MTRSMAVTTGVGTVNEGVRKMRSDTDAARARSGDRNLNGANLTGANLTDADLTGVHCDATTRWPAGFTPPTCAP
jgi:hypothetical protein